MSDSFKPVIEAVKAALINNSDLATFCMTKWKRELTVKFQYKSKNELIIGPFPQIVFTRPFVHPKRENTIAWDRAHRLRFRAVFQHAGNDKEAAAFDMIEFEELIEQALVKDAALKALIDEIAPAESLNDEGVYHPYYGIDKDVLISREENYQ